MQRDAIDFHNGSVPRLFRKLLLPTLLGTISIAAVTAIDGIFIGHGVGAEGGCHSHGNKHSCGRNNGAGISALFKGETEPHLA